MQLGHQLRHPERDYLPPGTKDSQAALPCQGKLLRRRLSASARKPGAVLGRTHGVRQFPLRCPQARIGSVYQFLKGLTPHATNVCGLGTLAEADATWNEFWKARDRSPNTTENEIKTEYYRRLRYADVNYGVFGRDGWKSDFGMVYITYGPPSEIERHPFDRDSKPYQVWYYYERKLRFLFVDHNGYGEYELQYPYDGDIRKLR